MKYALRYAVISAALLAGLAVTGASRTDAGVSFSGTFPLPHGQISIGVGDPYFAVGAYVPAGYQVYARSGYGYGFAYQNNWIPVRPYGSRWRVCGSPYFDDVYYSNVYYDPGYGVGYGGYYGGHYVRPSHRYAHRGSYPHYSQHRYAPTYHRDNNWNGHRDDRWSGHRDNDRNGHRDYDRNGHGNNKNKNRGHGNGNGNGHGNNNGHGEGNRH